MTIDSIALEVNQYVNNLSTNQLIDAANQVFGQDWQYMQYRKCVRIDGEDYPEHVVFNRFHDLYVDATQTDLVKLFNLKNGTTLQVEDIAPAPFRDIANEPIKSTDGK